MNLWLTLNFLIRLIEDLDFLEKGAAILELQLPFLFSFAQNFKT